MLNLVISNIKHRPGRTLTTIFGIAVGVLLVLFTTGLANGILRERGRREGSINAEIIMRPSGTMGIGGSLSLNLPESLADEVLNIEGVRDAVAVGQNAVESDSGFGQRLLDGVPFERYARVTKLDIIEGRGLSEGASDEAIVNREWQARRNIKVGDEFEIYERLFRVVGVYAPPGGSSLKIPLATMQQQLGGEGRASSVYVACLNPDEQQQVAHRITRNFPDYQIVFTRDLPEIYANGSPALNVFLRVITAVAASISTLVILLAMYTTIIERTRQIGILKALGMSPTRIAWVIEQEALLISVCGVAAGAGLYWLARLVVTRTTNLTIEVEARWVLWSVILVLLGGTLGALYPALKAARQDAVKALSYE